MKVKGGHLKKEIEIEPGAWDYAEIACREGSSIHILAREVDGDNFNVYICPSNAVKKALLIGTVTEYDDGKSLWFEEKVNSVDNAYISEDRDTLYIFFDNYHAKSKYKLIEIEITVDHPPLEVGDEPLTESFEVDAGYLETIDLNANAGDTVRVFGRVTKGNDITIHVLSKLYKTPDNIHTDKAYFTKEKTGEIDITYQCTKSEPLLLVFDNGYSLMTTKTVDVSVQVLRGEQKGVGTPGVCRFCSAKIDEGLPFCPHCGGKQ